MPITNSKYHTELLSNDNTHPFFGKTILPPFDATLSTIWVGMGCFWGAERLFWQTNGVHMTAVGYAGGQGEPSYQKICQGNTGYVEVVMVSYNPLQVHHTDILKKFWTSHDPTQGMRQGFDVGSQYRSILFTTTKELFDLATESKDIYQRQIHTASQTQITTDILEAQDFWYAESNHQQYLYKNPQGYCSLQGTGIDYD